MYRYLVVIFETIELKICYRRISYKLSGNKENRMAWAFSGALAQCNESSKRVRFGPELEFCLF